MKGEKRFETKIRNYLESKGAYVIKYFANSYTKSGIPDLICTINGYSVWIEVKDTKGKPSPLQLYHQKKIREAGGISIIVYPNQWEDLKLLIDDLINRSEHLDWNEQYEFDR